jgi:hypothetical protein
MRKMKKGKHVVKSVAKPTAVFHRKAKKPEDDDTPGRFRPSKPIPKGKPTTKHGKRLRGVMI